MNRPQKERKDQRTRRRSDLTPGRRRVLKALNESSAPTTEWALAASIAALPAEERSVEGILYRLHHVDLPKLSEAEFLMWDENEAIVRRADLSDSNYHEIEPANEASDRWDTGMPGENERRRTILELLESHDGAKERATLAYEVAVREHGEAITSEAVGEMEAALHHVHLPKLEETGSLEYDIDSATVTPNDRL